MLVLLKQRTDTITAVLLCLSSIENFFNIEGDALLYNLINVQSKIGLGIGKKQQQCIILLLRWNCVWRIADNYYHYYWLICGNLFGSDANARRRNGRNPPIKDDVLDTEPAVVVAAGLTAGWHISNICGSNSHNDGRWPMTDCWLAEVNLLSAHSETMINQ